MDDGKKSATNYKPVIEILKKFYKKKLHRIHLRSQNWEGTQSPHLISPGKPFVGKCGI